MNARLTLLAVALLLTGCDNIVALLADPRVAQKVAESKAIGSACRYGKRSIEDCYTMNEKASKASIFEGWKEMDQYMRDNAIEGVPAKGEKQAPPLEDVIESKDAKDKEKNKPKAKP